MILVNSEIEFDVRGVTYCVYISSLFDKYRCSLHLWGNEFDLPFVFSAEDFEGMSEADFYNFLDKEYRATFEHAKKLLEGN